MRALSILVILAGWCVHAHAQADTAAGHRQPTSVYVVVCGGVQSTSFRDPTTPLSDTKRFPGWNAMARLMWHPDHLLSVGITSGYTTFSHESFTATEITGVREPYTLTLEAIPLQVALSMQHKGLDVGIGLGGYLLTSVISGSDAARLTNTIFEIGFSAHAGYAFTIVDGLAIGPEVNVHLLSNRGILAVAPMIAITWDVVRY